MPLRQSVHTLTVSTRGPRLHDVTRDVESFVAAQRFTTGLLTVFCRHTSASLLVQENADSSVQRDIEAYFARLAPESDTLYTHTTEGPDDMPAHLRAALTQTQLSIPIIGGRLALGTWQAIYLFEHRRAPHRREIALHAIGE